MKFSYTSSSSSASCTSYTTTNYDHDNICHSKPATPGRFRGILRCFLCFNSLQTHPSDLFKEEAATAVACQSRDDTKSNVDSEMASPAPGLVARLMGLDSMPMVTCANLNSVRRTRSMDSLRDVELVQRKHRKVKSAWSFRDAPTFLELENEDFFILSFERGSENKKFESRTRKSDSSHLAPRTKGSENKKRRGQNVQESNKENQGIYKVSDKKLLEVLSHNNSKDTRTVPCPIKKNAEIVKQQIKKPINNNKTREKGELRKKKRKGQNCSSLKNKETESDSENASPVSVLDFSESTTEFEVPFSGLLCSVLFNLQQTKWMYKGVLDIVEVDEIAATFELEILDELLQELLDQVFSM